MINGTGHGTSPTRRHWLLLAVIIGVMLLVRLALLARVWSNDPSGIVTGDSASYRLPAQVLVEAGHLAATPETLDVPMTIRTPGYPVFIALVYLMFGQHDLPVVVLQIVLSGLTVAIVFYLGCVLWGPTAGLLGALLLTVDSVSCLFSMLVLTDTLFTLFLTASVATGVLLGLSETSRWKWALVSGLMLALATLIRPISYYLVVPIAIGWLVNGWVSGWPRRRTTVVVLLVVLPSVLLIGGWRVRNYWLTGSSEYCSIRGVNILFYRAAGVLAQRDGVSLEESRRRLKQQYPRRIPPATPPSRAAVFEKEGWKIIRAHPLLAIKDQARGLIRILLSPGTSGLVKLLGVKSTAEPVTPGAGPPSLTARVADKLFGAPILLVLTLFAAAHLLLMYVGTMGALWRAIRSDRRATVVHVLILGHILYLLLVSSGPESDSRFRVPIVPFLTLYAGGALGMIYEAWRVRRSGKPEAPT